MSLRGAAAVGLVLGVVALLGPAAAADDLVVDGTKVSASTKSAMTTATVDVLNPGLAPVSVSSPIVAQADCVVSVTPVSVPALESAQLTLTLEPGCPGAETITVDLDGANGNTPVVTVAPATKAASSFAALRWGGVIGIVLAAVALEMARRRKGELSRDTNSIVNGQARTRAHDELTARIREACAAAGVEVAEDSLPPAPTTVVVGWKTPLKHLGASWSFTDSWLANANVGVAGLVALLSTTDLLDAVLDSTPDVVTGSIAIAAAVSLALVATANAALRVLGTQTTVPTVGGFAVALLLCVLASTVNVVTLAGALTSLDSDLGLGGVKPLVVWGLVTMVLLGLLRYVWVSIREVLELGLTPPVGSASEAVAAAWVVAAALRPDAVLISPTPWERSELVSTYGAGGVAGAPSAHPSAILGTSAGDDLGFSRRHSAMP